MPSELYRYVRSGRYANASEVVRDALRGTRDEALRNVERKIEAGLRSAHRGEVHDGETVFQELRTKNPSRP